MGKKIRQREGDDETKTHIHRGQEAKEETLKYEENREGMTERQGEK